MYNVNIKESQHVFEKKNLMTIMGRKGGYDELVCKLCGMKGRSYSLGSIKIAETYKRENVFLCKKALPFNVAQRVKVSYCNATGKAFGNITPNSEHDVVTPPEGYKNDHTGVWVMGVGEPIKLLQYEFTKIE